MFAAAEPLLSLLASQPTPEGVTETACLFTIVHTPSEDQCERIVRDLVAPVATDLRDRPELDSLFYGCFSFPDPQVRFRVLGSSAWVAGPLRQEMERRLAVLEEKGLASGHEFGRYQREVERFGGEEGMRLTERIYHHDSLACLDLIQAEGRGRLGRSRREIAVAMTERILDLLRFDRARRLAFYEFASRWPSSRRAAGATLLTPRTKRRSTRATRRSRTASRPSRARRENLEDRRAHGIQPSYGEDWSLPGSLKAVLARFAP